jgi:photosystem II stability/assembly factor-like uncharacterized protein
MSTLLPLGTRKGLFLLRGNGSWEVEGPLLPGWAVYHAMVDPRDGVLHAATNNPFYGASVHRSSDGGRTWERAEELGLPEDGELKLNATWHIEPGAGSELWLGGDPGVLFRSDDAGATWELNRSLFEHPTRERWQPGAGGMCTHSIQFADGAMYVAISAAGAFRSEDGGDSWTPINKNVAAEFMPDPYPEVGQCVHKLLVHPQRPERLWQQNHCGVYRSDDRGDNWERLDTNGLPTSFGFPLALDPQDPDVAYVIPEQSQEHHYTADGRLGVYRTSDAGSSWTLAADGLPERAWVAVLREGLAFDDDAIYFGTQSGSVWSSPRGGGRWTEIARDLPPILSIEAAQA